LSGVVRFFDLSVLFCCDIFDEDNMQKLQLIERIIMCAVLEFKKTKYKLLLPEKFEKSWFGGVYPNNFVIILHAFYLILRLVLHILTK